MASLGSIGSSLLSSTPSAVYKPKVLEKLDANLYSVQLPDSTSDNDPGVAFVYSSKALVAANGDTPGQDVPTGVTYLKDTSGDYFAVAGEDLKLVASGTSQSLYVINSDGTADKYSFSAGNLSSENPQSLDSIAFSAAEVSAKRDLDGDGGIGGNLVKSGADSGILDATGGLYRIQSLGKDVLVVSPGLEKSKVLDISKSALRNQDGTAWTPDDSFTTFSSVFVKGTAGDADAWRVYATSEDGVTTKFNFTVQSSDKSVRIADADAGGTELSALELAADEYRYKRDLDSNSTFGVSIDSKLVDESSKTSLWSAHLGETEYLLIGDSLKEGAGSATAPNSLSGILLNEEGESWTGRAGYAITGIVQVKNDQGAVTGYSIYAVEGDDQTDKSSWDTSKSVRFDFAKNSDGNFEIQSDDDFGVDGVELTAFSLSEAEKTSKKDLNQDNVFGFTATKKFDAIGGLSFVTAIGENFIAVGKSISSGSSKTPTNLSTALRNADGTGWKPDDVDLDSEDSVIRLVETGTADDKTYRVYVKEESGSFGLYRFDSNYTLSESGREDITPAQIAADEKAYKRDLNGDGAYGIKISSEAPVDSKGGLYKGDFGGDSNLYVISPNAKLASGSTVANKAVDYQNVLLAYGGEYWSEDDNDYTVKAGYLEDENTYVVISANSENSNDVKQYTFRKTTEDGATSWNLDEDEASTGPLDISDLVAKEVALGRDLNGDGKKGVNIASTAGVLDKTGGLVRIEVGSGGNKLEYIAVKPAQGTVNTLDSALKTHDGQRWTADDVQDISTSRTQIVAANDNDANKAEGDGISYFVYSRTDAGSFSKYAFDSDYKQVGEKIDLTESELLSNEKLYGRDLDGDLAFGVRIDQLTDARGKLYRASFDTTDGDASTRQDFYLVSSTSLAVGSKSPMAAIDLQNALRVDEETLWSVDSGYKVTGGFADDDNHQYTVVAVSTSDATDVKKFTFDVGANGYVLNDDENLTGDYSLVDLSIKETSLSRDLDGNKIIGVNSGTVLDKVGGLSKITLGSGGSAQNFLVAKPSDGTIRNLSTALVTEDGAAWELAEGQTVAAFVKSGSGDSTVYDLYVKSAAEGNSGGYTYTKFRFGSDFVNDTTSEENEKTLTLSQLAADEVLRARDINGDKVLGALVNKVAIQAFKGGEPPTQGLYQASMTNGSETEQYLFVAESSAPAKGTGLSTMLLGDDGETPFLPDSGETLKSLTYNGNADDSETFTFNAFAVTASNEVVRYSFTRDHVLAGRETLTAEQLLADEKIAGKDLNGDTAVGLVVDGSVGDKKNNLYTASLLGTTYFVVGTPGTALKTDKKGVSPVDLSRALLDGDGNPWAVPENFEIGGLVQNGEGDSATWDLYTYADDSVKIHRWNSDFQFLESIDADPVGLVQAETAPNQRRDLNGDGAVGFKLLDTLPSEYDGFQGVTAAKSYNGSGEVNFVLAGTNLKSTASKPLSVKDALLTADGTAPWAVEDGYKITAIDIDTDLDSTGTTRFVYAKNAQDEVIRYQFSVETGRAISDEFENVSPVALAAREKSRKKDLNFDTFKGVSTVAVSEVRADANNAKTKTGLLQASLLGQDFFVIQNLPSAKGLMDLSAALLVKTVADDESVSYSAWEKPDEFSIKGLYQSGDTATVYGYDSNNHVGSFTFSKVTDPNSDFFGGYSISNTTDDGDTIFNEETATTVPAYVSGRALAELEASVTKDLNGDTIVGFKPKTTDGQLNALATNGSYKLAQASLEEIADLDSDTDDSPTIYIVGKNLDKLGQPSKPTANSAALFSSEGEYWKPADSAEEVTSLFYDAAQDGTAETFYVFTAKGDDAEKTYIKYQFGLNDGKWLLANADSETTDNLNDVEAGSMFAWDQFDSLISDYETGSSRKWDINQDGAFGLKVTEPQSSKDLLTVAEYSGKKYYFSGTSSLKSGTKVSPLGLDGNKQTYLLRDENNVAWRPDGDGTVEWATVTYTQGNEDGIPEGAAYKATTSNGDVYFNAERVLIAS